MRHILSSGRVHRTAHGGFQRGLDGFSPPSQRLCTSCSITWRDDRRALCTADQPAAHGLIATSSAAWRAKVSTSSSRGTNERGWRATFYTPGWSTRSRARPHQRGSRRPGARSRARHGRAETGRVRSEPTRQWRFDKATLQVHHSACLSASRAAPWTARQASAPTLMRSRS